MKIDRCFVATMKSSVFCYIHPAYKDLFISPNRLFQGIESLVSSKTPPLNAGEALFPKIIQLHTVKAITRVS
jgi:hypothetical protein